VSQETSIPVVVTSHSGNRSAGTMRLRAWDKKELSQRATKIWAGAWGLAAFSVILPLVHFFLVPAFLIAGPVAAWIVSTQKSSLLGGESTCPDCGAKLPLSVAADQWPIRELCSACQRELKVEKV
jgi:hypothetical protein